MDKSIEDRLLLNKIYQDVVCNYKIVMVMYNKILSVNEDLECIHTYEGVRIHPVGKRENVLFFNHKDKALYFENMPDALILKFQVNFFK
jgi:hypothetical protein